MITRSQGLPVTPESKKEEEKKEEASRECKTLFVMTIKKEVEKMFGKEYLNLINSNIQNGNI